LDKDKIAALLDALCERPLAGNPEAAAADAQAFASHAAPALSRSGMPQSAAMLGAEEGVDMAADMDADLATLASILSGTATAAERQAFEAAAARSGAFRIDAQSALAFADAVEQAPMTAPAHLVDAFLVPDAAAGASAAASHGVSRAFWSAVIGGRRGPRWASAFVVLLVAGGLSWWFVEQPQPASTPRSIVPIQANAPAAVPPPAMGMTPPELATVDPCAPQATKEVAEVRKAELAAAPKNRDANCAADPGPQFVGRPNAETEAVAARARAEEERQAAAAQAAAAQAAATQAAATQAAATQAAAAQAAAAQGATQAGKVGAAQADRAGRFGGLDANRPAAAAAPAVAPKPGRERPAAAAPAARPSAIAPIR
jgi:hypothetical protein